MTSDRRPRTLYFPPTGVIAIESIGLSVRRRFRTADRSRSEGPRPRGRRGHGQPTEHRYLCRRHVGLLHLGSGSWRIRPIPLPRSRTSAGLTDLAVTVSRHSSRTWDNENTSMASISRLQYLLPTLHAHVAMRCARLASGGWLVRVGWESNPLDSIEEVPLIT
jgi:hypothetical protein